MPHLTFQRARTEDKKRQRSTALVEAARSLALESGVASVTLTDVASRAGVHYSAVRRYFTSHKEVLLHLAAEGWVRWSDTVGEKLREPGPMSPSRVAETLAHGLAADPRSATCSPTFTCTSSARWISTGLSRSGGPAPLAKCRWRMRTSRRCRRWGARAH